MKDRTKAPRRKKKVKGIWWNPGSKSRWGEDSQARYIPSWFVWRVPVGRRPGVHCGALGRGRSTLVLPRLAVSLLRHVVYIVAFYRLMLIWRICKIKVFLILLTIVWSITILTGILVSLSQLIRMYKMFTIY